MEKITDGCVGCGKPCLGNACWYKSQSVFVCDNCGEEIIGDVYDVSLVDAIGGDHHWCKDCVNKNMELFKDEYADELRDFMWECINDNLRMEV